MRSYHGGSITGIDAVSGALVWVRRRNGSWWPGRILGVDEIPEDCVVPPRSGTPIKLLGRDDGSMDWYNLEKSTRVKAFRCGEYDKDIEKAKASAGRAHKKASNAGKYVRREDAILHALELERNRSSSGSEKKCLELNNLMGKIDFSLATQPKPSSAHSKNPGSMSGKFCLIDDISTQDLSQSVVSFEEPNNPSTADMRIMKKRRWRTPYDTEDDDMGETRRTRGLQDLALGILSERKPTSRVHKKGSRASYPVCKSNTGNAFSDHSRISIARNSFFPLKRKKSVVTHTCEKSKRKVRHRPLIKVLEGTTRILAPSFQHDPFAEQSSLEGYAPDKRKALKSTVIRMTDFSVHTGSDHSGTSCGGVASDTSENTSAPDGDSSFSEMEDNELSSLPEFSGGKCSVGHLSVTPAFKERETIDCPYMPDSYESRQLHPGAVKQSSQCSQVGILTHLQEELGETGSTGSAINLDCVGQKFNVGRTRLDSKGRRKPKYVTLSKTAYLEGFRDSADRSGTNATERTSDNKVKQKSLDEFLGLGIGCQIVKKRFSPVDLSDLPQLQTVNTTAVEQDFASEVNVQSAEDVNNISYGLPFTRYSDMLFTSDIAVSTMSPGKFSTTELTQSIPVVAQLYDVKLDVQRSHHGQRVPLVSLRSKSDDIAIVGHPLTAEVMPDGYCDSILRHNACYQVGRDTKCLGKNSISMVTRSRRTTHVSLQARAKKMQGKISCDLRLHSSFIKGKSSRSKKTGFSPRKIRRLSSLTVDLRNNEEERKPVVERIRGPAVACIPLRIVFSRINEALSNVARHTSCN